MLYREKFEKLFQEYRGTLRVQAVVTSAYSTALPRPSRDPRTAFRETRRP
jgi:hypothetical protein